MKALVGMKRLSELMAGASVPVVYARAFMRAVEECEFVGVMMTAENIPLKSRKKGGRVRHIPEFVVLPTPAFERWHARQVSPGPVLKGFPTFADLEAGTVDLEAAQQQTLAFLHKRRRRSEQTAESVRRSKARMNSGAATPG